MHDDLVEITVAPFLPTSVTIETLALSDSGYSTRDYTRRNSTRNYYELMQIGDQSYLVLESEYKTTMMRQTGILKDLPSKLRDNLLHEFESEFPDLDAKLLPVMLSASEDHAFMGTVVLSILIGCAGLGIIGIGLFIRRIVIPNTHPIYQKLDNYGDYELILQQIETDRALGFQTYGNVEISRKWVVLSTPREIDLIHLKDCVVMYEIITTEYWQIIFPVNKTHAIRLIDKFGNKLDIPVVVEVLYDAMSAIQRRAPWIQKQNHRTRADF